MKNIKAPKKAPSPKYRPLSSGVSEVSTPNPTMNMICPKMEMTLPTKDKMTPSMKLASTLHQKLAMFSFDVCSIVASFFKKT